MSGGNTQSVKGVTSRCCSASHLAPLLQPYLCYVPGDLLQELAYLRSHVFPHLDSVCQARGTCFRPVDIQQTENGGGDDDENQSDHNLQTHHTSSSHFQQLKISLDLISSSSSFFCILGQHYDCCLPESSHSSLGEPEEEPSLLYERKQYLHNAVRGGYPWVMEEQHRTCSLTELEITQAVFMGKNIRCFFYFKDLTAQGDDEEDEEGALFPGDLSNQRQCERQRMWNMKSWIINTCLPVRFFTSLQELKELVKKDWTTIIDQFHQIPEHCCLSGSGQDSLEVLNQESYIQALDHGFVPSKQTAEVLDLLNRFVFPVTQPCNKTKSKPYSDTSVQLISNKREQEKSILLLSGERGCGKSSLAVRWLQQFRNRNPKVPVIPYFCGTSVSSKDIRSMLRQCTAELRKNVYGDLPVWTEGLEGLVEPRPLLSEIQAFIAAAKLGPCIILIDGLDLLKDTFGLSLQEVKEMRWLPVALPSLCKLIVTTTTSDLTYKSLTNRSDIQAFTCPGISDPSIQCSILYRHLALPCKELSTSLLQKIIRRKICRLPVFLAVLGSELRTCGMQRDEKENELIEEYLEVDSVSQLWEKVIRRWVKDYSRPAEDPVLSNKRQEANVVAPKPAVSSPLELRGWVWDALCLIHVSRSGLTQAEVLALLEELGHCGSSGIRTLEWAQLLTAFGPWVQEKPNGCLCFNHQSLSQAIDLLLLGVADKQKSRSDFHHIIAEFFQKRSKGLCGWLRKLEELPWHLAQTGSFKELYSVLSDPEAVCILSSSVRQYPQLRLDLVRYWTLLSQREYDPVSSLQRPTVLNGCGKRDLGSRVKLALFSFDLLLGLGKPEEAGKILSEAETVLQQADELDEDSVRSLLEVQNMLAKFYFYMQQLDEAELYSSKGLKTADILTVSSSSHSENIRMIKGQFLCFLSQIELKRGCLYTVPGLLKEISSTGLKCIHPCAEATVTLLQGLYKFAVGELSAAESCVEAVLASRRRWYGTEHPLVAAVEEQLADIWSDSNHTEKDWTQRKATELFRHVIHVRESVIKSWGMTSFLSRPMLQDLTNTLLKLGKVLMQSSCAAERREALSLLQRATDLSHLLNAGHPLSRHRQHVFNTDISVVKKRLDTPAASRSRACLTSRLLTKSPLLHQSRLTSTQPGPATAPLEPKQNIEKTLTRPWTTFQTSVFGPQSDIGTLVPREEVCGSRKISSKEGSDKRPDRCRVQEEAVKALNRQMGMYVYRKSAR